MEDIDLARLIADQAGAALLKLSTRGPSGDELGKAGDATAQEVIAELLAQHRPDDAMLSEEAPDNEARLTARRVWIIDPLDGTRQYCEPGRTDWAVQVALWQRTGFESGQITDAVIALPGQRTSYDTSTAVPRSDFPSRLRIAMSRTRPPQFMPALARELDAQLLPLGSVGGKVGAILRGEADAYVHTGGQHEWDLAAPLAVAIAAGLHVSRLTGGPIHYNQSDPRIPDFVVCPPEESDRLLSAIAEVK